MYCTFASRTSPSTFTNQPKRKKKKHRTSVWIGIDISYRYDIQISTFRSVLFACTQSNETNIFLKNLLTEFDTNCFQFLLFWEGFESKSPMDTFNLYAFENISCGFVNELKAFGFQEFTSHTDAPPLFFLSLSLPIFVFFLCSH